MSKSLFPIAIIVFIICLVLTACDNIGQSQTTAPTATRLARATPTITLRPTLPPPAEPITTARPTDSLPATPTPIPTETPVPLPDFLQLGRPLGVNWSFSRPGANTYIPSTERSDSFVIVGQNWGPESGVYLVNTRTNERIIDIVFEAGKDYSYNFFGEFFYLVVRNEGAPFIVVEQWNLENGERVWQVTVNHPFSDVVVPFEEGLLIIGYGIHHESENKFILLDRSDGDIIWQEGLLEDCSIYLSRVSIVNNRIQILCDETFWFIATSDGSVDDPIIIRQGSIYHYIMTDKLIFMIRETGGFHYLEAWDWELADKLWSSQIPMDVWNIAAVGDDVVFRDGNQVILHDGLSGDIKWQSTIEGEEPARMLGIGQWLLVGSGVGYLHMLNVKTGEVIWKQDIWATIEPRNINIVPVVLTENEIVLDVWSGFLAIGTSQNRVIVDPTPSPTATPTITPTPTPIPTFSFSSDGALPEAPEAVEIWPEAITAFLNDDSTNINQLETLLEYWTESHWDSNYSPSMFGIDSFYDYESMDLNGDGRHEQLIRIIGPNLHVDGGWIIVLKQDTSGQFTISWSRPATVAEILSISDLNNDGKLDFVIGDKILGVSQASVSIVPVGWNGQEFEMLTSDIIGSTNINFHEVVIEDTTGDGFFEIIFRGGTYGSASAGPNRTSTFTYVWTEDGYVLDSKVPDLPQDYFFFLVEANEHLVAGDYEEAIAIYESSFDTEDAFYNSYYVDHQRAFAEFQLMLAYLLLGDEESAASWATSGNYPDELYTEVKQIFWGLYQETGDWTAAAEAARTRVRLAGPEQNQLVPWVGYANTPLTLEDILPCAECLQGSIGNQYGF